MNPERQRVKSGVNVFYLSILFPGPPWPQSKFLPVVEPGNDQLRLVGKYPRFFPTYFET